MQYTAPTWQGFGTFAGEYKAGVNVGHGDLAYYNSGALSGAKLDGCFGFPGRDSHNQAYSYEERFGVNIDAGAWDPKAQIRTTVKALRDYSTTAGCDNWTTYVKYVVPIVPGLICPKKTP